MIETKAEVFLPLSQGKVAVIDFEDFEKVRGLKWHAVSIGRNFYAARNVRVGNKQTTVFLHRVITDCPPDLEVNHIDGDGLNDRRYNLQPCTHQQHALARQRKRKNASSIYRGVSWCKQNKRWQAQIAKNGKHIHIGRFDSEEAAARAYDAKAAELFDGHSSPNLPD